jgi:hypothetical protein
METDKIVVYQSYIDPNKAYIDKGLLDSCEIECFLSDENMVALNAMYSPAIGGMKLHVFERDINRITEIFNFRNTTQVQEKVDKKDTHGVICPNCQSGNVSYGGSINRKFNLWHVFYSFILMMYPISMRKAYHCFDCNSEFKKD